MNAPGSGEEREKGGRSLALMLLVIAAGFLLQSRTGADPDLWGHVRFGQDLWRTGRIIHPDSYSYLSGDQPWINHEWLSEAAFALAYDWAGGPGLLLLKGAISLLLLGLAAGRLRRLPFGGPVVMAFLIFLLTPWFTAVRPQLFTYLFFLLVVLSIRAAEGGRPGWMWAVPPVLALWVNFHGGVLAGLGIFLGWAIIHLTARLLPGWRAAAPRAAPGGMVLAAAAAAALALLANPYGAGLPAFLLRTATVPRPDISEWRPILIQTAYGAAYLLSLAVSAAGFRYSRKRKNPVLMILWLGCALLPLAAIRHTPLFA
ncbi:MAG: hypothetical protein V3V62_14005, partial [bacterium]